ncbi:hypothetical protein GPNCGGLF_LOCUS1224 [Methylorubrum aminovorans]
MTARQPADRTTYAPFILGQSLLLVDPGLTAKAAIFQRKAGWIGNGHDWQSIAKTLLKEQHPALSERIEFDSEAEMFVARGEHADLITLAEAMCRVYHDDGTLTDLQSRAELD